MHARSVANHTRHRVHRLQNCVVLCILHANKCSNIFAVSLAVSVHLHLCNIHVLPGSVVVCWPRQTKTELAADGIQVQLADRFHAGRCRLLRHYSVGLSDIFAVTDHFLCTRYDASKVSELCRTVIPIGNGKQNSLEVHK